MELTEKSFIDRIKKIVELSNAGGDEWEDLCGNLKEKGVEYCLILPLFEVVLDFDPLVDIRMEVSAGGRTDQRFDFIIQSRDDYSLVIECKSFLEDSIKKYEGQVVRYMEGNQELLPWGILTNGLKWDFYLSKEYIERKYNEGTKISPPSDKILKVFSLELKDELFIPIMNSMGKGKLRDFWNNITKYALAVISPNRGRKPIVHPDRQINTFITEKILENIEIKEGDYFSAIINNKIKEGDEVICKNDFIEMKFNLDAGGRLVLKKGNTNVFNLNEFTKECSGRDNAPLKVVSEWMGSTNTFATIREVILALTGYKKVSQQLSDKFPFDPPPPETN